VPALQASDPRTPVFSAEIMTRSAAISAASASTVSVRAAGTRNSELGTHFAKMTFSNPVNLGHEKSRKVTFGHLQWPWERRHTPRSRNRRTPSTGKKVHVWSTFGLTKPYPTRTLATKPVDFSPSPPSHPSICVVHVDSYPCQFLFIRG
jgi:hypothetical protein